VSAGQAIPAGSGSRPRDPVCALQHALYRAAKADPGRRFHALMDKVFRWVAGPSRDRCRFPRFVTASCRRR
jgi:hypothetical protein